MKFTVKLVGKAYVTQNVEVEAETATEAREKGKVQAKKNEWKPVDNTTVEIVSSGVGNGK